MCSAQVLLRPPSACHLGVHTRVYSCSGDLGCASSSSVVSGGNPDHRLCFRSAGGGVRVGEVRRSEQVRTDNTKPHT